MHDDTKTRCHRVRRAVVKGYGMFDCDREHTCRDSLRTQSLLQSQGRDREHYGNESQMKFP